MEMKLELVLVPVADADRAKAFYVEQVGFRLDHDVRPSPAMRVVQLTPPGSACSIVLGTGLTDMVPGTLKGLHLVVADVAQVRSELLGRGVAVGELIHYPGGITYAYFRDPDGNSWALQQISSRA
ncbi:MAG: VOC family protein [Janthinobacterium lividum]